MTFFDKLTLLKQLEFKGISTPHRQTFSHPDLFGTPKTLQISLENDRIFCQWFIGSDPYQSIQLALSEQGRTKIAHCQGFSPPIKTVSEALEHIQQSVTQMPKQQLQSIPGIPNAQRAPILPLNSAIKP